MSLSYDTQKPPFRSGACIRSRTHCDSPGPGPAVSESFASFSTATAPSPGRKAPPADAYNARADTLLMALETQLEEALVNIVDMDIESSYGVLTLRLGSRGTYVINKQAPTEQIWWSSPVSGPKRFEFEPTTKRWLGTRDAQEMTDLLATELQTLCKQPIHLKIDGNE